MESMNLVVGQIYEDAPYKANLVLAGAGWLATSVLFSTPGASKVIWGINMPYHDGAKRAFLEWGTRMPYTQVDEDMVHTLAEAAHEQMSDITTPRLSIALSAALQTDRERKGEDHAYIKVIYEHFRGEDYEEYTQHITLSKDLTRDQQEEILSIHLLNWMWDAYHDEDFAPLKLPYQDQFTIKDY